MRRSATQQSINATARQPNYCTNQRALQLPPARGHTQRALKRQTRWRLLQAVPQGAPGRGSRSARAGSGHLRVTLTKCTPGDPPIKDFFGREGRTPKAIDPMGRDKAAPKDLSCKINMRFSVAGLKNP